MSNTEIYKQFKELSKGSVDNNRYNVISITEMPHKLGVSPEGYPKFFVCTNKSEVISQDIIRELLTVENNLSCTLVENEDEIHNQNYSIITLNSSDESLHSYFIEVFIMILLTLPQSPSRRELNIGIENLITIFSALNKKPIKKIQGLWTELLVIERSINPSTLINAWHSAPGAKYDFTMGKEKIEVKSTSSEDRIHTFSLDQLNPTHNSELLIASAIVRESAKCAGGMSVRNLYERICERVLSADERVHLSSVIAETIGEDFKNIDKICFDYIQASDTLAFFEAAKIPHIDKNNVPEHVSGVKFNSNLSHVENIKDAQLDRTNNPLFQSLY